MKMFQLRFPPEKALQLPQRSPQRIGTRPAIDAAPEPFVQLRPPPPSRDAAHSDCEGFLLAHQHDQLLAPRDSSVEQIPLQHGKMLGHHRDDDSGILGTLADTVAPFMLHCHILEHEDAGMMGQFTVA